MGSGFQGSGWNPWQSILFGFHWVPASGFQINYGFQWVPGPESEPKKWVPMGSGFRVGTQKVGSSGFRVPGRNPKSGFQWVPGSGSEPKKWVPVGSGFRVGTQKVGSDGFRVGTQKVGSGFQVGTQKVGSGGFRVPTKIFFVPTPDRDLKSNPQKSVLEFFIFLKEDSRPSEKSLLAKISWSCYLSRAKVNWAAHAERSNVKFQCSPWQL